MGGGRRRLLDRKHTDVCLNTPVDNDTENTRRGDIGARREMIPGLEFRPDCRNHVLQETTSLRVSIRSCPDYNKNAMTDLNDRDSSPQQSNRAPEENHGNTPDHSTVTRRMLV